MEGWRSHAALAQRALGSGDGGVALAREELGLARRFGAPRSIGIALRAAGLVEGSERGIELLREAVTVLEGSQARLEHARALIDLGAALRRANQRVSAREYLRPGVELAHSCGAHALMERAREELAATGARPRRIMLVGVDALTASERRVAQLAADGLTNVAIAQALFVTQKTVESHLRSSYQKLAISSRKELDIALRGATPS
jgi:DNA-binding CsgD family transcriptional regulator